MDLCGSSYGSPTLQFQSTAAFQQYGAVLGLEVTSENAQTNSADVKKYEVIYGIAGIHSNYPAPPGVRSTMVLGSPAVRGRVHVVHGAGGREWAGPAIVSRASSTRDGHTERTNVDVLYASSYDLCMT